MRAVYTENAEAQMHCCIPMGHLDAADARLTHMQKLGEIEVNTLFLAVTHPLATSFPL